METGLLVFRVFLGFCSLIVMALMMWGLRAGMFYMGREFALGFGAGFVFLGGLLILHRKVTGKDIFTC